MYVLEHTEHVYKWLSQTCPTSSFLLSSQLQSTTFDFCTIENCLPIQVAELPEAKVCDR